MYPQTDPKSLTGTHKYRCSETITPQLLTLDPGHQNHVTWTGYFHTTLYAEVCYTEHSTKHLLHHDYTQHVLYSGRFPLDRAVPQTQVA